MGGPTTVLPETVPRLLRHLRVDLSAGCRECSSCAVDIGGLRWGPTLAHPQGLFHGSAVATSQGRFWSARLGGNELAPLVRDGAESLANSGHVRLNRRFRRIAHIRGADVRFFYQCEHFRAFVNYRTASFPGHVTRQKDSWARDALHGHPIIDSVGGSEPLGIQRLICGISVWTLGRTHVRGEWSSIIEVDARGTGRAGKTVLFEGEVWTVPVHLNVEKRCSEIHRAIKVWYCVKGKKGRGGSRCCQIDRDKGCPSGPQAQRGEGVAWWGDPDRARQQWLPVRRGLSST